MDDIFQQSRLKLIDLHAALQKEEATLDPLINADSPDETKVLAQIDKVAQARAELEKSNARMLLCRPPGADRRPVDQAQSRPRPEDGGARPTRRPGWRPGHGPAAKLNQVCSSERSAFGQAGKGALFLLGGSPAFRPGTSYRGQRALRFGTRSESLPFVLQAHRRGKATIEIGISLQGMACTK